MAAIRPFQALRYNTRDPLSVALVTAPPYDCITPDEQEELYRTHPHNIVRIILGKPSPSDTEKHNRYTRAAGLLAKWRQTGILVRDPEAALYFYRQEFEIDGKTYLREGFLGRVGLEEFGSGHVFPHEETMPGPREDRLKLIRATRANTEPIFGLFPDPPNEVTALFHEAARCEPLVQTVDGDGVVHRLFGCHDAALIGRIAKAMAGRPIFIADGHHRYETALSYKREREAAGDLSESTGASHRGQTDSSKIGPDHPAASVLMLCVSMHHPGLAILPTHRIVAGLPDLSADRLRKATEDHFNWQELVGADATSTRVEAHLRESRGHAFGLWTRDTTKAFILTLKDVRIMDHLAADHSKAWRRLDVAILDRAILKAALPKAVDPADRMKLSYVHLLQRAFDAVHEDGADAAFILRPLPIEALQEVAGHGERMPAKSTYFYPKALSGLVINLLE